MEPGAILAGRYHIIKKIGQGGMQEVFLTRDNIIEKIVVIKTPLEGQAHRRFKTSAQLAAKVNNHGIAKTLDYFEQADRPFLVEEYILGDTLDKSIIDFAGYIDPHIATIIFTKLAKGISASHHAGVVHRDLKPSNIIVSGGFSLDAIKVTDFGIATLTKEFLDEEISENSEITESQSKTVKGALPYMAPEMIFRNSGRPIEFPADIWSLGCIMFHALTARYPFGAGMDAVLAIGNNSRIDWPAFMTSDSQFKHISLELQSIIDSCLNPDPENRPTAKKIAERLSHLCVFSSPRKYGVIRNMHTSVTGFIRNADGDDTMLPVSSVYGPNQASNGKHVVFSCSPGRPRNRAFPVLVGKD